MSGKVIQIAVITLSLLLYTVSFFCPALTWSTGQTWLGWVCFEAALFIGWSAFQFECLSNLFYLVSLIFLLGGQWRKTIILNILAIIFGLETLILFVQELPSGVDVTTYNVYMKLASLEIGYFLWMAGFFVILVYSFDRYVASKNNLISIDSQTPEIRM